MTTKTTKKKSGGQHKRKKPPTREEALIRHYKRPSKARIRDECEINKNVTSEPTLKWLKDPGHRDVLGIDVPTTVDERGRMRVSKKVPDFCISGPKTTPGLLEKLKGRKINPVYDPDYVPE